MSKKRIYRSSSSSSMLPVTLSLHFTYTLHCTSTASTIGLAVLVLQYLLYKY
jgi:hypothetical protein